MKIRTKSVTRLYTNNKVYGKMNSTKNKER